MKGMELARKYYETYGEPMLKRDFPELYPLVAAGLFGSGSECFGFDDEVSRDHDFEPGFCLLLPGEELVSREAAFRLERAYAALPGTFEGVSRNLLAPVGGRRHGVLRTAEVFYEKTGTPDGCLSVEEWLSVPEYALAEAVNGEMFYDGLGQVTAIRKRLAFWPEDVRKKKLAGFVLLMGQAGQYNYGRCLKHGETGAAQLAVTEFVRSAMQTVFLLNRAYMPYYKWSFRAMRRLPKLSLLAELLEYLLTTDNEPDMAREKQTVMESISQDVIEELRAQGLTKEEGQELEKHAYAVNNTVKDGQLRNRHILWAVS